MTLTPELHRRASNRAKCLAALREAGARGILNVDLIRIAGLRAGARVQEWRDQGYVIDGRDEGQGRYRYTLLSEPTATPRVRVEAIPAVVVPVQEGRLF